MAFYIVLSITIGAIVGVAAYFIIRALARARLAESLRTSLFLIKIPKTEAGAEQGGNSENKDFKSELAHFEQLLGSLAAIKKPIVFEVAVPHIGEEIHFYLGVPKLSAEVATKQIQGLWNGASVELMQDDFNIFNVNGATAAAYITEKENYALPIRTYAELGTDSFESIVGAFAKINEVGEGAALQLVVRPAFKDSKKVIQRYIEFLKKGESLEKVLGKGFPVSVSDVAHVFNPKTKEEKEEDNVVDDEAIKALQMKAAKPLFDVNVRLVASAGSPFQADDILDGLTAGFSQFNSSMRNDFRVVKPKNPKKIVNDFIYRTFDESQKMTLSVEEIASIYHLPISSTETPHVKWLKSKEAPPPDDLPKKGLLVGESVFRGQSKPIYITDDDRRRHIYVIGQTGTGKSTLLGNMIIEDIQSGKGVAIIDPHGDLVENALGFMPRERLDDIIYFNPGDLAKPLGLNMLDFNPDRPEEKTFIVNEMQSIFNKLFPPETMGPMFEQYMRNALLLMMEDMPNEPATLVEIPRIFTDSAYRARKLARIHNPVVIDFWEKEAVKAGGEASLANMTPYITSKFNNFISNDYMRPIIGQAHSAFNFRQVMDEGKILLINLSKGKIGDINAGLLGMVFTGKILMAALSRVDVADADKRRDFNLYIDEFQNFTTDSIATILSEARKYRLNLTMAHQFIAQLEEKIKDAVFGNVGSELVFRVGVQDAEFLVKQFEPTFNQNDLINIDNLNAYAKLLINGQTSKPFNLRVGTASWGGGDKALAEKLKEYSRVKYGMDRQAIEDDIFKRLRE
jgi:Helicase HerA, central domain/TraM recognition site of TraD and TraG